MNLSEELDRSFGEGPALPPVHELLPVGRRALARRRRSVGAAAFAVVAVVVGMAAVGSGLLNGDTGAPAPSVTPADGVSDTADPTAQPPSRAEIQRVFNSGLVEYDGQGSLVISPRTHVEQRLDNPYDVAAPRKSVAIAADIDGATYWFAFVYNGDGTGNAAMEYSGNRRMDFAAWVAAQASMAEPPEGDWPGLPGIDLVRFAQGDRLEALEGVTLSRQVAQPELGPAWAGPDDRSAAAEVVRDGERYYVLARASGNDPAQYIAVTEADGGPTLEVFLDFARDRYAEGGGGLL